jgi:dihydroneopterin aldolase
VSVGGLNDIHVNLEDNAMARAYAGCQGPAQPLSTPDISSMDFQPSYAAGPTALMPVAGSAPAPRPVVGYALRLRGVRVHGHMGVSDAERARPQELVLAVDLELSGELYPSMDELERATDYSEIVRAADECAREQPYRLLETYALHVGRRLVALWPAAERVRVSVTKAVVPVWPRTDEATVEVTLGQART